MAEAVPLDRRQRRRQETIEEVLDIAAQVMADQGVAGLTLGEVARRMGIRPPSLYVYFDSKNALYDALFERGYRLLLSAMEEVHEASNGLDPVDRTHTVSAAMVRWSVEHPAYAPLMFWRPVPGFVPSTSAYAPAVALSRQGLAFLTDLQAEGALRPDVDLETAFRTWTALTSGIVSQQLSNAPGEPFDTGIFTSVLADMVAMWLAYHAPAPTPIPPLPTDHSTEELAGPEPSRESGLPPGGRCRVPAGSQRRDESKESR
jgi:AcrR family transcriptional regulator